MTKELIKIENIQSSIYTIRSKQVMLDKDLATLYDVKPIRLREQVKRNINRFPDDFMFQLSFSEVDLMVSQNAIPSKQHLGGSLPYVFTEQGVAMLSAVLRSDAAIRVSVQVMKAFVEMKKFVTTNASVFQRLDRVEQKLLHTDENFDKIFKALEDKSIIPKQGIFYNGQVFDAYKLISDIIRSAKNSVVLIDNYVDDSVLMLFTKCRSDVEVLVYTKTITKILKQDLEKYNAQYSTIKINKLNTAHDRFLIIDNQVVYHFGASLKDLGKKWFAFSKLDMNAMDIIEKL
jgi:hypothetical protein